MNYDPRDWYWIVGGDETRVYASARAAFVPADDAAYAAWCAGGNASTHIASFDELNDVLRAAGVPPYRMIDGAEFLARLTDDEYGAILAASAQSIQIARWLDTFRLRGEIDITGSTAQAAKAGLVKGGLLTSDRADVIFAPG